MVAVLPAADRSGNRHPSMQTPLTVLGLESSCDDTAAAVVRHAPEGAPEILSSVVLGQTALHAAFGGVVPEIAARAHAERLDLCRGAGAGGRPGCRWPRWTRIAVTAGPGLIGGVLSGVMLARGLAAATGLPLIGVNHLAGHALTPRLTDGIGFPYLMLLVSGGHCQFLIVSRAGPLHAAWAARSTTRRARPSTRRPSFWACRSRADRRSRPRRRWAIPRALPFRARCWTGRGAICPSRASRRRCCGRAMRWSRRRAGSRVQDRRDLCAGFQAAVADVLAEKTRRAMALYLAMRPTCPCLPWPAVWRRTRPSAAMLETVSAMARACRSSPRRCALCTDNAAMIAWAGIERLRAGVAADPDFVARSALAAGRDGARADRVGQEGGQGMIGVVGRRGVRHGACAWRWRGTVVRCAFGRATCRTRAATSRLPGVDAAGVRRDYRRTRAICDGAEMLLVAVPMQALGGFLAAHRGAVRRAGRWSPAARGSTLRPGLARAALIARGLP